jgi:hypothetical protein
MSDDAFVGIVHVAVGLIWWLFALIWRETGSRPERRNHERRP